MFNKPRSQDDTKPSKLPPLGRLLLAAGVLDGPEAELRHQQSIAKGQRFLDEVLNTTPLSPRQLAQTIANALSLPLLDLDAVDLRRLPRQLLEPALCADFRVLPVGKRDNRLVVATADPTHHEAHEKITATTRLVIQWVVVEHDKLEALLTRSKTTAEPPYKKTSLETNFDFGELTSGNADADSGNDVIALEVEDTPVVRFLQKMLIDAVQQQASDLHFEPYEHVYRVRFRIDGELKEITSPPVAIKDKLASRIKVLSRLDISEKRLPQDGRMKLKIDQNSIIDFRVSTLPTLFGEKIVIRVLDPNNAKLGIDALGYEADEKRRLLEAIARPYGMVLVTGPTGSGKTVSLYTCLNILNRPGVNISTAEDPSEINLPGVNQVNINEKSGLNFSTALRAFLRQDPDVIMVGEIRDLETADIAIKAAQTGHLVLSTLHTNDAPATLTRMLNMGIPAFNIAASVTLITAQRLARKLCTHCKIPTSIPTPVLLDAGFNPSDIDGSWTPYKPVGCRLCNNGYKGRLGIYQVMPINEEMQRIIVRGGTTLEIAEQAKRDGVRNLRESGLNKFKQGLTSLEEIISVTNS